MHLLFYGREQTSLLQSKTVENRLREQSIKVIYRDLYINQTLQAILTSNL